MGFQIPELLCFRINTNSTNSDINIYALGFRIIDFVKENETKNKEN